MKSKSVFLMAVSLGFGLVAAIGITQVMGRNNAEPTVEVKKQTVMVAVEDLDINTELTPEMFSEEQWPVELVPEGVVASIEEIEGKVTTSRVGKKGPVFLSNLVLKSELREKKIPAGFKVIGISMGSDDHIYGLLEPGDLVDLIAVFRATSKGQPSSQTFLRKVRVFSVASRTSKDPENRGGAKGNTVVGLLVTEKQSEQIVLVKNVADLKLAMRSNQESADDLRNRSAGTRYGDLTNDGFDSNSVGDIGALARMYAPKPADSATTADPAAEIKQFTTVVYTSDGPTQYHFDTSEGNVPKQVVGFGQEPTSGADETDPLLTGQTVLDLEGEEKNIDGDFSIDELDSEPGD